MSDFDQYSLSGCMIDDSHDAPRLSLSSSTVSGAGQLPPVVDLRKYCSPVEDQQKTGSCVANAVVGAMELLQRKEGHSTQDLSRLFVYFNSRSLHQQEIADTGTGVPFAMAAIIAHGICEERMWPFSMLTVNDPPTQACFENASNYRGVEFAEIERGVELIHVLAQGIPVIIAVSLPREAYISANQTGVMALPQGAGTAHDHGAHAMLVVGYDLEQKAYIVRNSWGERFAKGGYFLMPMEILAQTSLLRQTWAIGSLGSAPGLQLLGRSVPESVAAMVQAAASVAAPSNPNQPKPDPGKGLRDTMQADIDKARAGFASRLRGK